MIEDRGNLWTYPANLVVITTNGFVKNNGAAVMGRGCALEATKKFPGIEFELGKLLSERGNHVHLLRPSLATFPVKHNWWEVADMDLIAQSAHELVEISKNYSRVVIPRPGCGNGKLDWKDVKPVIAPILVGEKFIVITF